MASRSPTEGMMRALLVWVLGIASAWAIEMTPAAYDATKAGVRFIAQKVLHYQAIEGVPFSEVSDLAYDRARQRLYMIGDEGSLFVFRARFSEGCIEELTPLRAVYLRNKKGKRYRRWKRDSEGLALDRKGHLYVSFEGKPRVVEFGTEGKRLGVALRTIPLPKVLRKAKRYRSKNKALEALAYHPRYGLVTAPEWPLKALDKKCHTIYALRSKRRWCFRGEPEARSGISALEITDDGYALVIERSFRGFFKPLVVTLKKVDLHRCAQGRCASKTLVKMSTHQGWDIDNFEGLARVGSHRYVMISDDNDNFFQRTMLVYYEVRP